MTSYLTAAGLGTAEYEDKKSRFLAHVKSVATEAEARDFLAQVKKKYPDATHHVYAWVLREGNVLRWSDDGEPGGTSGQPTLAVLQGAGLTDVCCVTARYFGGTLLGSGGLVRAYTRSASDALDAAAAPPAGGPGRPGGGDLLRRGSGDHLLRSRGPVRGRRRAAPGRDLRGAAGGLRRHRFPAHRGMSAQRKL